MPWLTGLSAGLQDAFKNDSSIQITDMSRSSYGLTRAAQSDLFGEADRMIAGTPPVHVVIIMMGINDQALGSGAYVALERITGTLGGRTGSFALVHRGMMQRGAPALTIEVVPDSGTDGLAGLRGAMQIVIEAGKHSYALEYELP